MTEGTEARPDFSGIGRDLKEFPCKEAENERYLT